MSPRRLALVGLGLALWAGTAQAVDAAIELTDVGVQSQTDAVRVEVRMSGAPRYRSELIDTPYRLVLDFEDTLYRWTPAPFTVGVDPVRVIRGSQFRKDVARLVIELMRNVPYTVEPRAKGVRVVFGRAAAPAPSTPTPAAPGAAAGPLPAWRLEGTVLRAEGSIAYIADAATSQVKRYRVGDPIGDGVVETIEERLVVLSTPRGPVELKMDDPRPARAPRR